MKLIFWGIILLAAYRFWYVPKYLKSGSKEELPDQEADNGEFADYEEVDED